MKCQFLQALLSVIFSANFAANLTTDFKKCLLGFMRIIYDGKIQLNKQRERGMFLLNGGCVIFGVVSWGWIACGNLLFLNRSDNMVFVVHFGHILYIYFYFAYISDFKNSECVDATR